MSLASLRALEGKGASAEDIQMARIVASHKAAMAYAQASESQDSKTPAAVGSAKVPPSARACLGRCLGLA